MLFHRERPLSPFAVQSGRSRGRLFPEQPSPTRTEYQRDRDRIIHSTAFRRLKHKTQVFIEHEGDHYRTRLTHTIEVAQIARALARALALDEDLAEALALAHDLGHPPFGHAGEDVLDEVMAPYGGFDHNAQALRIVTRLEHRYAAHDGLNLTWETLEGLVKHNGPLIDAAGAPLPKRYRERGIPGAILEFDAAMPLGLASFASAEAQCAAIADDIAYNAHDIDDGLRAGLFALDDLRAVPFLSGLIDEIDRLWPGLDPVRCGAELIRRVITRAVEDVIGEAERRLVALAPASAQAIRDAGQPVVTFSSAMAVADADIKAFLYPRMYRHPKVMRIRQEAGQVLRDLFARYFAEPGLLPEDWRRGVEGDDSRRARRVADYLAGMTDRYAVNAHRALFDATPALV
jgi:dGTPase